ncbi:DUF177 domain-containing protein [Candidatus Omnitrophota bacterium]
MKIAVARLKEGVMENFQESLTPGQLDIDTSEIKYKSNIDISSDVKKDMQVLLAKTHLSAAAELTCSRCLKEFNQVVEKDFDTQYPLDKMQRSIDITQDIREEVILGYPLKFLCKPDCRGLCPECGKDLNSSKCNCKVN